MLSNELSIFWLSIFATTLIVQSGTINRQNTTEPLEDLVTVSDQDGFIQKYFGTNSTKIVCDSSQMLDHHKATPPRLLVLALIAAKLFPAITKVCPESSLFVIFGIVSGVPIGAYFPTAFNQEHFFDVLLPMIVLEASYFMSNTDLVKNLKKILTFAVIGTFLNMILIGAGLELAKDYYQFDISLMHLLVFATILSAVDPVAVICVFEDIGVNENLYINVFGESLLNDGVSVVFFRLFSQFATEQRELSLDMLGVAVIEFFKSAIGGTIVGLIGSLITVLATKHTFNNVNVQPLYIVFVPYCVYLFSEYFHISGIISIMICVITMKPYTTVNLNYDSKSNVSFIMKAFSSCSESYIFMFLGISVYQVIHNTDIVFCIVGVTCCIVGRFLVIFFLSFFLNIGEPYKLSYVDQFVMAYGGLRGAVCFGLVMSLDPQHFPCKQYFASSAIVVIVFTIFIQGMTIKNIVDALRVTLAQRKNEQSSRFEIFGNELLSQTMDGIAAITGRSFTDTIFHQLRVIHETYFIKWFWHVPEKEEDKEKKKEKKEKKKKESKEERKKRKQEKKVCSSKAILLNVRHEALERNEGFEHFKKFGSFAALSAAEENGRGDVIRKSQSMCQPVSPFSCGLNIPEPLIEEPEPEPTIQRTVGRRTLPRNMSDRKLLTAIFEDQKTVHSNFYSRHFSGNPDDRPSIFTAFDEDEKNDEEHENDAKYFTVPNPSHSVSPRHKPIPNFSRRDSVPVKAGSSSATKNIKKSPVKKNDRPTFFMGDDHDESKHDAGMITFKTGRFQVAKQSPSHSNSAHDEASALLKIEEEKDL
uniref:Sodium/hydrogen exchanger n=1 Tax=Panagrolaimus sp. ES5 TaxID=591445 RepID=A0AC34GTA8_9BILA